MNDKRHTEQAFKWVETLLSGRIVAKHQQERWRPQWFLDVDTGEGIVKVVLRGFRNSGYASPTEAHARETLKFEAGILKHLQDLPVTVPKFYGYNEQLDWLLMERLPGDADIMAIADRETRFHIFRGYLEDLARLHCLPLDAQKLPDGLDVPANTAALVSKYLDGFGAIYRNQPPRKHAEPGLEFGLQWLQHNPFTKERPMRLGLGDTGPGQFLFEDGRYKSLLDFEFSMVADPLLEIGLMRIREMAYPMGGFGELIEYYGRCCQELTGESLDTEALQYWTIFAAVVWPLLFNPGIQNPNPLMPDQVFLHAFEIYYQRALPEALAEKYGFALEMPHLPQDGETVLTPLHDLLIAQFDQHYVPGATSSSEGIYSKSSAALVRTLARGDRFGAQLNSDNLDELSELLGGRPADVPAGLKLLEDLVIKDYQKDFEKRIRFFHRFEVRKEYLYAPMQSATGLVGLGPLAPLVRRF